jgi:hypothetical protein
MNDVAIKNLFPLGIATGVAHCNRKDEREDLKNSLRSGRHTWLWARRRMGKTSLIEQVLSELRRARPALPSVKLDLNVVHDAESLEERIRDGAARLGVAMMPRGRKHRAAMSKAFSRFRPEFSVGAMGVSMSLSKPEAIVPGISEVLMALDSAAAMYDRRAVLVMDEFQQITSLTYGGTKFTLEGAIRHAVERARNITYVFSGSERRLLQDMFEQPDRPLYRHCEKMTLTRIDAAHYQRFFDKASTARWGQRFPGELTDTIMRVTRRHPYYVNALCSRLWDRTAQPTVEDIAPVWQHIAEQDEAIVSHLVRNLSATQRAMLVGIALAGSIEFPTGREFLESIRLSASTGNVAKDVLEENDLIRYTEEGRWELVDPIMASYIQRSYR